MRVLQWGRTVVSMPGATSRDRSLDGLRAIAVILTFFVHFAGLYLALFRGGNPDAIPLAGWTQWQDRILYWLYHSHHGVQLFFVLSGFLICRLVLRPGRFDYGSFIRRRFLRIYPAFLLAFAICLSITTFLFKLPLPGPQTILANLLFLNGVPGSGIPAIVFNNVTWSLFFEACFYVLFPLVAVLVRRSPVPPAMILVLAGLVAAYLPNAWGISLEVFLLFFAGALVGLLDRDEAAAMDKRIPDELLALVYLFITTSYAFALIDAARFTLLFSAVGALVVLKAAHGSGAIARCLAWGPLAWLGGVSYSFYLLHCVALYLVFNYAAFRWMPPDWLHAALLGVISFAGALILAALSFALTERFYFRNAHPAPGLAGARPSYGQA